MSNLGFLDFILQFTPHNQCISCNRVIYLYIFFLFMNFLFLGLIQQDLAHRFGIGQLWVALWTPGLTSFILYCIIAGSIWLDDDTVKSRLPDVLEDYAHTQIILDCSELRCQTPSYLLQREVFKGLIGIAPHGAVTFVSSLYQGAISDKDILKQSGIVGRNLPQINPKINLF